MTSEVIDLRQLAENNLQRLVRAGPGCHAYALHRAQVLEREYPWNEGLAGFVRQQLGPAATAAAERDIKILKVAP